MKLSDALRGAADRAPLDEATVDTGAAARRIKRDRAMRMGANGLVGAGAVAVIAVGALGPLSSAGSGADDAAADFALETEDGGATEPGLAERDESAMFSSENTVPAFALCGSELYSDSWGDPTVSVEARLSSDEIEPGGKVDLAFDVTAHETVDLLTPGPEYVVTWDGIAVGVIHDAPLWAYGPADETLPLPDGLQQVELADGETFEQQFELDAVNCWDGSPLPAGKYEVHAWQSFALATHDFPETTDPEPHDELTYDPSTDPGDLGSPGDEDQGIDNEGVEDAGEGSGPSDGDGATSGDSEPAENAEPDSADATDAVEPIVDPAGEPAVDVLEPEMPVYIEAFRVAVEPIGFVVAGEPVDDPFGEYLAGPEPAPAPEPLPEGYLTPDIARDLYAAGAVSGGWDMAAGTQRWLKMNDSLTDPDGSSWERNYFGCVWDGGTGKNFPSESAEIDLLDVTVGIPSSISVSYGFVVDGNPKVTSEVRNTSEYTIPGFWSGGLPQMYLVKNGEVVAQANPESLSRGDDFVIMEDRAAELDAAAAVEGGATESLIWPGPDNGLLEPGAVRAGEGLWRDVDGCGTPGAPYDVQPGTYTVLTLHTLSISNEQYAVTYGDDVLYGDGIGVPEPEPLDVPETDLPALGGQTEGDAGGYADEPYQWDWVELQVWTSLGTVTIR